MPLSDRERRLLAEMEQALSVDDPRLVSALSGGNKVSGGVIKGAVLTFIGIAILFAGLVAKTTLIGGSWLSRSSHRRPPCGKGCA
jgi:hypothetical protein